MKYWYEGQPVNFHSQADGFGYWYEGAPYTFYELGEPFSGLEINVGEDILTEEFCQYRSPVDGWFDPNWKYCIRVSYSQGSGVNQVNIPFTLHLSQFVSNKLFDYIRPDGMDIVICDSDGVTVLDKQLIYIDTVRQAGKITFKAPVIETGVLYYCYLYFGNANEKSANSPYVWDEDYLAVYHFKDDPALYTFKDFTRYGRNARKLNPYSPAFYPAPEYGIEANPLSEWEKGVSQGANVVQYSEVYIDDISAFEGLEHLSFMTLIGDNTYNAEYTEYNTGFFAKKDNLNWLMFGILENTGCRLMIDGVEYNTWQGGISGGGTNFPHYYIGRDGWYQRSDGWNGSGIVPSRTQALTDIAGLTKVGLFFFPNKNSRMFRGVGFVAISRIKRSEEYCTVIRDTYQAGWGITVLEFIPQTLDINVQDNIISEEEATQGRELLEFDVTDEQIIIVKKEEVATGLVTDGETEIFVVDFVDPDEFGGAGADPFDLPLVNEDIVIEDVSINQEPFDPSECPVVFDGVEVGEFDDIADYILAEDDLVRLLVGIDGEINVFDDDVVGYITISEYVEFLFPPEMFASEDITVTDYMLWSLPYILGHSNCDLLLHLDRLYGSVFQDSGRNGLSVYKNGTVTLDTSIKKFGDGSALFLNDGNSYLYTSSHPSCFNVKNIPFVFEARWYPTETPRNPAEFFKIFWSGNNNLFAQTENYNGQFGVRVGFIKNGGGSSYGWYLGSLSLNSWHTFRVYKDAGDTFYIWVDGNYIGSINFGSSLPDNGTAYMRIGLVTTSTASVRLDEVYYAQNLIIPNPTSSYAPASSPYDDNAEEGIGVDESVTVSRFADPTLIINRVDTITVTEVQNVTVSRVIDRFDTITATENLAIVIDRLVSVSDDITITEYVLGEEVLAFLSNDDLVTVAENLELFVTVYNLSVYESFLITESISVIDEIIEVGVCVDSVSITSEPVQFGFDPLLIGVYEDISIIDGGMNLYNGLLCAYRMNDNAGNKDVADFTGRLPAQAVRNTNLLSVAGKLNNALNATGFTYSDFISSIGTTNLKETSVVTFAFWFKAESISGGTRALGGLDGYIGVAYKVSGNMAIWSAEGPYSVTPSPIDGGWHLAIGEFNRYTGKKTLWLDDVYKGESAFGVDLRADVNKKIVIGNYGTGSNWYMNSPMDFSAVWKRALTAGERSSLWNGGVGVEDIFAEHSTILTTLNISVAENITVAEVLTKNIENTVFFDLPLLYESIPALTDVLVNVEIPINLRKIYNVWLLTHFEGNGVNGSAFLIDNSAYKRGPLSGSNGSIDTSTKVFGKASGKVNNGQGWYFFPANDSVGRIRTNTFFFETRFQMIDTPAEYYNNGVFWYVCESGNAFNRFYLAIVMQETTWQIKYGYINASQVNVLGRGLSNINRSTIDPTTWHTLGFSRDGAGNFRVFLDGTLIDTYTPAPVDILASITGNLEQIIGGGNWSNERVVARFDEQILIFGDPVKTATYTPATEEYNEMHGDDITVSESATLELGAFFLQVNVNDAIAVTEDKTVERIGVIAPFENITVSEYRAVSLEVLNINIFDSINVYETFANYVSVLNLSSVQEYADFLCHFNSQQSSHFIDDGKLALSLTELNTVILDTGTKLFGAGSGRFDNASYVYNPSPSPMFAGSNRDFTLEFRARWVNAPVFNGLFTIYKDSTNYLGCRHELGGNIRLFLVVDGGVKLSTAISVGTLSSGTWYTIEVTKSGNTFYILVDGVYKGQATASADFFTGSGQLLLGYDRYSGNFINGGNGYAWVDEAYYQTVCEHTTSDYTPLNNEYPNDVADTITITESLSDLIDVLNISVVHNITLSEYGFLFNGFAGEVDVNDAVSIEETYQSSVPIDFNIFDEITSISEQSEVGLDALFMDVLEPFHCLITEWGYLVDLVIELGVVMEAIYVNEDADVFLNDLNIDDDDASDDVNAQDSANVSLDVLVLDYYEEINAGDYDDECVDILYPSVQVDDIVVSEFVDEYLTNWNIVVSENISGTEDVLGDILIEVSVVSNITVTEEVTMTDIIIEIWTVFEAVTVTEDLSIDLPIETFRVDSVIVEESIFMHDIIIELGVVFEDVSIIDYQELEVLQGITALDDVVVHEWVNIFDIVIELGIVTDDIAVDDSLVINLLIKVDVLDSVAVAENLETILTVQVDVFEGINASENVLLEVPIAVDQSEEISVTEAFLCALPVDFAVGEDILVQESQEMLLPTLMLDVLDPYHTVVTEHVDVIDLVVELGVVMEALGVQDEITLYLSELFVDVSENIAIDEQKAVALPIMYLFFSDDVLVEDYAQAQKTVENVIVSQILTVSEQIDVIVPIAIDVFEAVIAVSESLTMWDIIIELGIVSENVDVSEFVEIRMDAWGIEVAELITSVEQFVNNMPINFEVAEQRGICLVKVSGW